MSTNSFLVGLMQRNGPAYGAGPAGFKRLMRRLGNPQDAYKIIHVAGTNGKGSVCYLCAGVLQAAGYRTGLFISPHLISSTERIGINGSCISSQALVKTCKKVLQQEKEKLNFFEILTAAALVYFAEQKTTYVVLETGLGGRKDPTNICRPVASVITSIGLDHCALLGNSLEQIAWEKAGIFKAGVPAFCPSLPGRVLSVMRQAARRQKADLCVVRAGEPFTLEKINWSRSVTWLNKGAARWRLGVLGNRQVQNACMVYQVCRKLGISEAAIKKGLSCAFVPGRFEMIHRGKKTIILDGAHNPQAIENLMRFMQDSPWKKNVTVVGGFMADKDYPAMLRLLGKQAAALYLTTPGGPRAATLAQLKAATACAVPASFYRGPAQALKAALRDFDTVLVTGSFYLVGQVRT